MFEDVGDAALAGLAVDADDVCLVDAADVGRIKRQVRHVPALDVSFVAVVHALGDGILVRAGESGEDELPAVRLSGADFDIRELLVHLDHGGHVFEVELRVDAMGVQVHAERDDVDVAGALAVAEQGAFDSVRAGQLCELCVCHAGAAVVVRMRGDEDILSIVQVLAHVFDLGRVDVRHAHLHRAGQVDDRIVGRGGLPDVEDRVAHLECVLGLGAGEALRGILESPFGFRVLLRIFDHQLRAVGRDLLDGILVLAEDLFSLRHRCGVVQMDDGGLAAFQRLEGLLDDMLSGLGQYLDLDVVGDQVLLDQFAAQFELRVRSCREADFDLLEPDLAQVLEELQLLFQRHGHDQSLVTVAQVDAAPQRGLFDVVLVGPVEALFGRHVVTDLILADIVHFFPVPFYSIYRFA